MRKAAGWFGLALVVIVLDQLTKLYFNGSYQYGEVRPVIDARQSTLMNLAAALIIGGARGNLVDRVIHGHVIDFIQVYWRTFYWPAFNIADSAICVGAVLMVIDGFRKERNG